MTLRPITLAGLLALAACNGPEPAKSAAPAPVAAPDLAALPAGFPPKPGAPGGLPLEKLALPPAEHDAKSAEAAADVVRAYFAAIEAKRYAEAQALVGPKVPLDVFQRRLSSYPIYRAVVGRPGEMEGAAGSSFVEVPIQTYGRMQSGETFNRLETVQLRRVNDVPGATPEQLSWRIQQITVAQPTPSSEGEAPK